MLGTFANQIYGALEHLGYMRIAPWEYNYMLSKGDYITTVSEDTRTGYEHLYTRLTENYHDDCDSGQYSLLELTSTCNGYPHTTFWLKPSCYEYAKAKQIYRRSLQLICFGCVIDD